MHSTTGVLSKHFLTDTPTELRYIDQSVFMRVIRNQHPWMFELSSQESVKTPIWIS